MWLNIVIRPRRTPVTESDRQTQDAPSATTGKKPYRTPTLTECGTVAKLTMAKGTTTVELGQVVRRLVGPDYIEGCCGPP